MQLHLAKNDRSETPQSQCGNDLEPIGPSTFPVSTLLNVDSTLRELRLFSITNRWFIRIMALLTPLIVGFLQGPLTALVGNTFNEMAGNKLTTISIYQHLIDSEDGVMVKKGWVPYESVVPYGGAEDVVNKELEYVARRRGEDGHNGDLAGIALSGGGIRSATFALGVLQRLAREGWLKRVDYLSTVSGGGYIGSALTWFLHKAWDTKNKQVDFGVAEDDFPFGTHRRAKLKAYSREEPGGNRDKAAILRFLRQHGKYLTPGDGINILSLFGVVLRGTFLSLAVYIPFLILVFLFLHATYILRPTDQYPESLAFLTTLEFPSLGASIPLNFALVIAIVLVAISIVCSMYFAVSTYREGGNRIELYKKRRSFEVVSGRTIVAIGVLAVLGSLPFTYDFLEDYKQGKYAAPSGLISTILGFVASVSAFRKSGNLQNSNKSQIFMPLLVWLAAILLLYGPLLLSFLFSQILLEPNLKLWAFYCTWVFSALVVGRYVNLNYITIHRYYRDRLMETFMPNVAEIIMNGDSGKGATEANATSLSGMCPLDKAKGPYHIINTNIVLVESLIRKYRGRGGDNFILTPYYCGSNATGWRNTNEFMNNSMTLATAMAISGAAANPDTGVGGEGPTRNPIMSLLMSLLNIRLGYWAPHPDPTINRWQKTQRSMLTGINPLHGYRPNFFVPTLTSTALGKLIGIFLCKIFPFLSHKNFGKNEKNRLIELTDGGHFENLGIYELIRRRLSLIIVCDGAADPDFKFDDLANVIEKVRVDFGTLLKLDIEPLIPSETVDPDCGVRCAERGFVVGEILYPDDSRGTLIYLKTTFMKEMYPDLLSYKKNHPQFPDQSTTDQFFDEKQFEAYRELGYFIAKTMTEYCKWEH